MLELFGKFLNSSEQQPLLVSVPCFQGPVRATSRTSNEVCLSLNQLLRFKFPLWSSVSLRSAIIKSCVPSGIDHQSVL